MTKPFEPYTCPRCDRLVYDETAAHYFHNRCAPGVPEPVEDTAAWNVESFFFPKKTRRRTMSFTSSDPALLNIIGDK